LTKLVVMLELELRKDKKDETVLKTLGRCPIGSLSSEARCHVIRV